MTNDRGRCNHAVLPWLPPAPCRDAGTAGGALGLSLFRPTACVAQLCLRRGLGWCQGSFSPARTLHWAEAMSGFTLSLADELRGLVLPVPARSPGVFRAA